MLWPFAHEVDLLSGAGWVGSVVAADDSGVCTRFAGTVGPSGRSSCSHLETTYSAFAQVLGCWVAGHKAGAGKEQSVV
jgi:hypothetical protein